MPAPPAPLAALGPGPVVRALVVSDIVDSTRRTLELGDADAASLWLQHDRIARELLAAHGGREIDRSDGFLLLFEEPGAAVAFALAYQRAQAALGWAARAAVHVGLVVLRANAAAEVARGAKPLEVDGLAKPYAARLMALARGGQLLLSAEARIALGEPGPGLRIDSHGHYRLKGFDAPREVFEIGPADGSFEPPADGDKAYRVVADGDGWRPARQIAHNLPAERDAFVGRGAELRTLAERLDTGARLITVVGPGGTGKTRLVRRYARAWLGDWPGGVAFCDLSEARGVDGLTGAVAAALGVPLGRGDEVAQLGHAIAARGSCLVVLDNFEQLVGLGEATIGAWLDRAGHAAFIVTSRERTRLAGEVLMPLAPLPDGEAQALFAVRVAAHGGTAAGPAHRDDVARLVAMLEGMPLAIELAAARAVLLSPAQIVARLGDRFSLLAATRQAPSRQRTLRATIDWSWSLLGAVEQRALAQCSVFEGGFGLEDAEAVIELGEGAPATMDVVQALVDKSLVRVWLRGERGRGDAEPPRLDLYASIREYAAERLQALGAAGQAFARHARRYAAAGSDDATDALARPGGVGRRRALALELDNLVAACRRAVAAGDGDTAALACRAAWEVLEQQGPVARGIDLAAAALGVASASTAARAIAALVQARAQWRAGRTEEAWESMQEASRLAVATGDPRRRFEVEAGLGDLSRDLGRPDDALRWLEAALARSREIGHRRGEASTSGNLGALRHQQGLLQEARYGYVEALAIYRELGDRRNEGLVLCNLGTLESDLGFNDHAARDYEASIEIAREVGNRRGIGIGLANLGTLHHELGRLGEARRGYAQACDIARDIGDRRAEGVALSNLGRLEADHGSRAEAAQHYGRALAIAREIGSRRDEGYVLANLGGLLCDEGRLDEAMAHLREALAAHESVDDRGSVGSILGAVAEVELRQGRAAAALATVEAARERLLPVGNRLELAKLVCLRGRAELAAGRTEAALATLGEAETEAKAIGAAPGSELGRHVGKLRAAVGGLEAESTPGGFSA